MGPPDQPDYVNAVVRLDTRLDPHALLKHLQSIECAQGRTRDGIRWGPRTIDELLGLIDTTEVIKIEEPLKPAC